MSIEGGDDECFRYLLESVADALSDLVYFKDSDHRLVHVGETYAEIFDEDPEDLLGKTAEDLWPGEAEGILADERQVLDGEKIVDRERRVTHPDGTTHWYSENKIPRYDADGNVVGLFAIDREITEQKKRETELERYQAFVEHASDIIAVVDSDGVIDYVSPSVKPFWGYSPEDLIGELAIDYVHPEDRDAVLSVFRQIITEPGERDTVEFRFRRVDGSWGWIESSGVNRTDIDGIEGLVLVNREISDRKEKEMELEKSRRRYRSLFENNPLVIWEEDFSETKRRLDSLAEDVDSLEAYLMDNPDEVRQLMDTVDVISVNENAVDYYDASSKAELLDNMDRIFTDEAFEQLIAELLAVANGETRFRMETVSRTLDGHRKEELLDMYVPEAYADDFSRVYLTCTEITERKELHQRLSVVNRILRHDIRSAVSIIQGNANLAATSENTLSEVLDTIQEEADRLFRLAENARHIEGVLSDRGENTETIDLAPLITAKVLNYRNEYPGVAFEQQVPDSIRAEVSVRFEEALEKLLSNAIEHNHKENPEISVTVTDNTDISGWVEVRIADNGPGIPDHEIEPIERGEETDLTHTSGLGLWVVYWIVNESGGELAFENNEPSGTTVTIRLPPADAN